MKERPILFTPENAQKAHVSTKTQTRRIIKPQPRWLSVGGVAFNGQSVRLDSYGKLWADDENSVLSLSVLSEDGHGIKCPYGVPGDRLWCKEAWRLAGDSAHVSTKDIPKEKAWLYVDALRYRGEAHSEGVDKWRSGMLMPRWACRTVLEITEIRVQRVQEISEEDAVAEGCLSALIPYKATPGVRPASPRIVFSRLWDSINGPGSWDANPWVWAITFKKVQP